MESCRCLSRFSSLLQAGGVRQHAVHTHTHTHTHTASAGRLGTSAYCVSCACRGGFLLCVCMRVRACVFPEFAYRQVEGEIKSFRTFIEIEKPLVQVVGIPGKEALKLFMKAMQGHDNYWLFPDPGSDWREKTAGTPARIVPLPEKIDDMINGKLITRREIYGMMNQARRN